MFDTFNSYRDNLSDDFNFTPTEWMGLIIAGNVSAAISFFANSGVLALHGFMLWYKPVIVNRLSLRMIVLSSIFNMVYCCCQLVIDDIGSLDTSCRALALTLIAADTMACMCLAMVGLNLVTIFVLKVIRSIKLEIFYYCFIALSGILVTVIPAFFGSQRGPKVREKITSCWYSLFFDGRISKPFHWMWYYGWLLFSLAFAAICAGISIRFVLRKQDNFAGTLDMFTRRSRSEVSQLNALRKYSNSNTDIFTKIARRCICYPLGLMVSVIYFTDPAIGAVIRDFKHKIKKKYVFDYYTVKFQPASGTAAQAKSQYPQLINIIPLSKTTSTDESNRLRTFYFRNRTNEGVPSNDVGTSASAGSGEPFISPLNMTELQKTPTELAPDTPAVEVTKSHREPDPDRRYSVVSVTAKSGKVFLPNEIHPENQATHKSTLCLPRSNVSIIPMRRVSDAKRIQLDGRRYRRAYSKNTEAVEMLVSYKYPHAAKCMHWLLTRVFKVKPDERRKSTYSEQETDHSRPKRVFFDYTESSNPGTPINLEPVDASEIGSHDEPVSEHLYSPRIRSRYGICGSDNSLDLQTTRAQTSNNDKIKLHSIRRVSSINIASLYRNRVKEEIRPSSSLSTSTRPDERISSHTLGSNSVFANQLGISKLLSHGGSFSWSRLAHSGRKSNTSSPIDPNSPFSTGDIEMKDISPSSRSKEDELIVKDNGAGEESSSGVVSKSVILAPFSSELSPRPDVQYRKRILIRRRKPNRNSAPIRKPICRDALYAIRENDDYLFSLSMLYDGERNEYDVSDEEDVSPTANDILQPESLTLTPTEGLRPIPTNDTSVIPEYKQPLPAEQTKVKNVPTKGVYEGFVEAVTTINYISNWQEDTNGEASRITVYSEPWDIEEQYKEQLEFAENIIHI
ncbi:hypothetical protein BD770DRAFT_414564 [Pilaira anomala]|nr:hypothetical protein BD770DRAFT_414564 [Pilaira anomala]